MQDYNQEALQMIEYALKIEENEPFLHNKAVVLSKMGREEESEACIARAAKMDSDCSLIHLYYGIILYRHGLESDAMDQFQIANDIDPSNIESIVWKARMQTGFGDFENARKNLDYVLTLDVNSTEALFTYAVIEEMTGNIDGAISYLMKVLTIDESEGQSLSKMATILIDRGEEKKGMSYLDKAIKSEEGEEKAHPICIKAAYLSNAGKRKEALALFKKSERLCKVRSINCTLPKSMAITLLSLEKFDESIKYSIEAIKVSKDKEIVDLIDTAIKALNDVRFKTKKDDLLKSNKIDPVTLFIRGKIYLEEKNNTEATRLIKESIKKDPSMKLILDLDPKLKQIKEKIEK